MHGHDGPVDERRAALAHFARTVGVEDDRQVHKGRHVPPKRLVQQPMVGCGGQPLLSAQHIGDVHQVVIHDHSQVVDGHAVALQEHGVVQGGRVDRNAAPDQIVDLDGSGIGHDKADRVFMAAVRHGLGLPRGQSATMAVIARRPTRILLSAAQIRQPRR